MKSNFRSNRLFIRPAASLTPHIYNKLYPETDKIPQAVQAWVVKPIELDDVPVVVAVLWSNNAIQLMKIPSTKKQITNKSQ